MAEVFGIVSGALSIASLFNNCVECFEYTQLGRNFGPDFERYQLRLDVLKTRLGRWAEANKINENPQFSIDGPKDEAEQLVMRSLQEIERLFDDTQKKSRRYELTPEAKDLERFDVNEMKPVPRRLHNRLTDLARRRQKRTNLVKKAAWALYDKEYLGTMIENIATSIDELERLLPAEATSRKLVEIEIEEVGDEPSLTELKNAAGTIDRILSNVTTQKITMMVGNNSVNDVKTEETAAVLVGDDICEMVATGGISIETKTTNSAKTVTATGKSTVQIGNRFGGKGFLNRPADFWG